MKKECENFCVIYWRIHCRNNGMNANQSSSFLHFFVVNSRERNWNSSIFQLPLRHWANTCNSVNSSHTRKKLCSDWLIRWLTLLYGCCGGALYWVGLCTWKISKGDILLRLKFAKKWVTSSVAKLTLPPAAGLYVWCCTVIGISWTRCCGWPPP